MCSQQALSKVIFRRQLSGVSRWRNMLSTARLVPFRFSSRYSSGRKSSLAPDMPWGLMDRPCTFHNVKKEDVKMEPSDGVKLEARKEELKTEEVKEEIKEDLL